MPAMPGPRRVARKSVAMLMGLGLSKGDAARVVVMVCDEAVGVIWSRTPDMDVTWLADIIHEASEIGRQQGAAAAAVTTWSEGVARWARDFDRGHRAQRQDAKADQPGRHAGSEFWPDSWPGDTSGH